MSKSGWGKDCPVQLYGIICSNRKFWGINLWFWNIKITHKIRAKIASLNSSIARGALRSRRCLQAPGLHAPAASQVSKRNILELSDANFARIFGVISTGRVRSDMKRACFPRPGTSTVRVYKYEKWHFSTFFSSKNDFSTVCKYENHCTSPSCFGTLSRKWCVYKNSDRWYHSCRPDIFTHLVNTFNWNLFGL